MKIHNNSQKNNRSKGKIHRSYQIKSYKTYKKLMTKMSQKNISLDGLTSKSYYK